MREQHHHNLCDLELRINGDHIFFVDKELLCSFSAKLRRMAKSHRQKSSLFLQLDDFPGGPQAFELAARFCYSHGNKIHISPSNISVLHCVATTLEMTGDEPITSPCNNLLPQTEAFLDTLFHWTWHDLLTSLRGFSFSSPSHLLLFHSANTSGLLHRLSSSLLAKIFATSDTPLHSSPSSSYSPELSNGVRPSLSSFPRTPEPSGRTTPSREWWFEDLTTLHPKIIEKITTLVGPHENGKNLLLLTRFLLHYLSRGNHRDGECSTLADATVRAVLSLGKRLFSCRGLFRVLRVASSAGLSSGCRERLESLMGSLLDQATLDDLLVSAGHHNQEAVYDVDLVLRLVKVFVGEDEPPSPERLRKVGKLLDLYLGEVSPDQGLKPSKFQSLAESLPDDARDCFDGVYVALDIYLQSHPGLTVEERVRLCCRCLNYDKLSVEARRDLAKNPRVPPRAAVRALLLPQQKQRRRWCGGVEEAPRAGVYWKEGGGEEEMKVKLEKMQRKVIQLERSCRAIQGKMSKMTVTNTDSHNHHHHNQQEQHQEQQRPVVRGLPRLC